MDCAEAREHLSEVSQGQLDPSLIEAVRAHVDTCVPCAEAFRVDAEARTLVWIEAPRYATPPALRARIQAFLTHSAKARAAPARFSGWRAWLFGHPWTAGGLAGAVAIIVLVWAGSLWMARDPVVRLLDRAVAEHLEYVKETMPRPAADPQVVIGELERQVDYSFEPIFAGDPQVQLVAGEVSDLPGKRAVTLVYRDGSGRYTTLFLMPEAGIVIPAEGRMPIETFKPYHRVISGRQLLLWKQGSLAYLMVSDLDRTGLASMFLKIRKAI